MKTDFNINPESFYQSFEAPDGDFDDSEYCEECGKHESECKCKNMEPLKSMKPQQVLTEESIHEIKRAINFLETFIEQFELPNSKALIANNIEKLKSIITDTE